MRRVWAAAAALVFAIAGAPAPAALPPSPQVLVATGNAFGDALAAGALAPEVITHQKWRQAR